MEVKHTFLNSLRKAIKNVSKIKGDGDCLFKSLSLATVFTLDENGGLELQAGEHEFSREIMKAQWWKIPIERKKHILLQFFSEYEDGNDREILKASVAYILSSTQDRKILLNMFKQKQSLADIQNVLDGYLTSQDHSARIIYDDKNFMTFDELFQAVMFYGNEYGTLSFGGSPAMNIFSNLYNINICTFDDPRDGNIQESDTYTNKFICVNLDNRHYNAVNIDP